MSDTDTVDEKLWKVAEAAWAALRAEFPGLNPWGWLAPATREMMRRAVEAQIIEN